MRSDRFKRISAAAISMLLALVLLVQPLILSAEPVADYVEDNTNHALTAPTGLLTNEAESPMNVEGAPLFDWWVNDPDYDEYQTAYEIRLYDGITDEQVWSSGKVNSGNQNCVPYTGDPLKPGYPYSWEVRTWDSADAESPFSERAHFATGLGNDNWGASWIQGINEDSESPLSIIEEETEDVIIKGKGYALNKDCAEWTNYSVSASVTPILGSVGLAFRASLDMKEGYVWQLTPGVGLVRNKVADGRLTELGEPASCTVIPGQTYGISVKAENGKITTTLDGTVIDEYTDPSPIYSGSFGFYSEASCKTRLHTLSAAQDPTKHLTLKEGNGRFKDGYAWTDYTVEFDMVIEAAAAGFMIRCPDGSNGYMWQFNLSKGGLARHKQIGGKMTKLDGNGAVKCSITQGAKHRVSITVSGNTITTYLDGNLVNTYTDDSSTFLSGTFGFRQGSGEIFNISNITVKSSDGTILARETTEIKGSYSLSKSSAMTLGEHSESGYSTEFSNEDLGSFVSAADTLPIKSGAQKVYWAESKGDGVTLLNYGLDWTDYTLSLDVQVNATSAGIVFRAPDNANSGYMWAVRSDGKLRLHKGVDNKYSRIGTTAESDISLGFTANKTYHVTINVSGDTITTYVDGKLVNTRTSNISSAGSIGFRTDRNECGRYTNVVVTDPDGNILFSDDFSGGAGNWGTSGALNADNSYWYSRKEVELDHGKEVKWAIAYVSGSQDYELNVNGIRIGRAQTFDYPGETRYQGWDITDAVKGNDALAIGVLTSYYGGGQGRAVSKPGLLGKFVVYYTDGTSKTVVTDETWLTHKTAYSNLGARNGEGEEIEYCDANLVLSGWADIGYDTTGWVHVIVHGEHPTKTFYNLVPDLSFVEETRVSAVSVTRLPDGTTVADFGKVIPARIIIHFPLGEAGKVITVQEGYELLEDGSINTDTDSTQSTNMTYVYTMKDGEQTFEAWNHLAFRYVSVPAEAGNLEASDFEAIVVHAGLVSGRESTLETSDDMLNKVYELMQRSALYSVQNQFVDTPTREKGQFLYDTINISAATTVGSYERQMTRKAILQFLASSDRLWSDDGELGVYNAVYPSNDGARDIPEFTLSVPIFVWRYYMLTGDVELLEFAYPYMKNTAGYVDRNINSATGLVTAIEGGTSSSYRQGIIDTPKDRFGYDWSGTLDGVRTTINAHCVRVYDTLAKMSEVLGYSSDAELYCGKADDLRDAMNEYLVTASGLYCDGLTPAGVQSTHISQHANSHAIMAGVPTEDMLDGVADYIAGLGMRQGTMTADILMSALFETGNGDAAVKMLTNTKDYGWAKIIDRGYTFIWETWHGGSLSHGWGSASLLPVVEYVSGVKLIEAGAKVIRIDPTEGSVDEVKSHTVTARGAVDIYYTGSGKNYVITIDVPANMTAEVVFPVIEGGSFVEITGKNGENSFTEDSQIMTVGSGKRTFVYRDDAVEHSYKSSVTAPTCTEKGYTSYTCEICGDTLVSDYVDALGHSFDDWTITSLPTCSEDGSRTAVCTVCHEQVSEPVPKLPHDYNEFGYCSECQIRITSASVKLGADLSIKYYVSIMDESILSGAKPIMEFSMGGKVVASVTDYGIEGGKYTFILSGISPQQMADEIDATVKIYRNGYYVGITEKTNYSIRDNCVNLLNKSASELGISEEKYSAMRTLISDLLAYGDAAADYRDYTENGYATDGVEGLTPSDAVPGEDDRMILTNGSESLYFKSASVKFDTVNSISVKLFSSVADKSLVTVKVNGTAYSLSDLPSLGNGVYGITTEGISATDFDEPLVIELLHNGVTVGTLTYSVNAYTYAMVNNATENEAMIRLALALYRYGRSAEAYSRIEE